MLEDSSSITTMARMHSRKKGKSGSKKPLKKPVVSWLRYTPKEVELLIVKLGKEAKSPSHIGLILRDTYGIPDTKELMGKSISHVLKEKNILPKLPEDLMALIRKNIMVKEHLQKNHKDMTAKHGLELTESKIRRLVKYYKASKRIPAEWIYDPDKLKLLVE